MDTMILRLVAPVLNRITFRTGSWMHARCRFINPVAKWATLVLVMVATVSFGNDSRKLLEKIRENYASLNSCSSNIEYKIYRGFNSEVPVEEYNGLFLRNEGNTFRRIDQSDFINLEKEALFISIDHHYREITLSNAVQERLFDADLKSSLKYCSNIASSETSEGIRLVLYLNKKAQPLPYTRIDLEVDRKYRIRSLTLYYSAKVNFSKDFNHPDFDRIKMKINYVDFDPSWKVEKDRFEANRYVTIENDTYVPSELYKNYTIVDLRKK